MEKIEYGMMVEGVTDNTPNYLSNEGLNMYGDMNERFYNGFGENKAEAFHNAMQFAIENNEPESVLEMLYDCQNILRGENDFVHAVEVEYLRLNAEIRGFKYECYFHIERL